MGELRLSAEEAMFIWAHSVLFSLLLVYLCLSDVPELYNLSFWSSFVGGLAGFGWGIRLSETMRKER